MSKKRAAKYNAAHDALHAEIEAERAQEWHYTEQLSQVPEDRFEGDQIKLDLTRQERREDRFREVFQ